MSPLWRNRLCIAISPERISMLKLGRGLKPKVLGSHDEAVMASANQASWQVSVERLGVLLAGPDCQGAEASIVLSNRLVQYAAITFDAGLKKYSEQEGYARHMLTQTYGPVVGEWDLRIQKGKEGMPWLVSAVDRALLEALRQACATNRLKLRSITPHLMPVFNRFRNTLKADPAWLVVDEPGHALFVLFDKGEFAAINGVNHGGLHELPMLLDREALVAALPEQCRTVYLNTTGSGLPAGAVGGYEVTRLETPVPGNVPQGESGLYALALGGVS